MAKVLVKFQDKVLSEVPLDKDIITIGRKPGNAIHIDNLAVSGFHAKVFKNGDAFIIEDMGSLNGTFVNGMKISRHTIRNDDTALIGKHTLHFIMPEAEEPGRQAAASRSAKMDETLVLDPYLQQKMLQSIPEAAPPGARGSAKGGVLGCFIVIEGSTDRNEYELRDRITTIGKGPDSGIRLKGLFAPRIAALVNRRKEGYFISPVGKSALRINGGRINERYDLKDGDIVEMGKIRMQFYLKE